jgi:osmoprotectant transport system ATP-binding protein
VSASLQLRGVTKRFAGTLAVDALDLDMEAGRTTVLLGTSGCGKSTILRMIIGLVYPDAGTVLVDGHVMSEGQTVELRRRMGYVVQGGGLFPHLTAEQNVTLMARHLRWEPRRIAERVASLVALTQFPEEGLSRYPSELSGGQAQRVSLMRALLLDPDLLLLDEPLGALDPITRFDLQADLRGIFSRLGKTVVLVTHDLGEAAFFGQRIVLLQQGRVVQQGSFQDLVRSPADPFVTRFINAQRAPPGLVSE